MPALEGDLRKEAFILAGGSGVRLWPLSSPHTPKPFLALPEGKTLLVQAFERALSVVPKNRIWVCALKDHVGRIRRMLPGVPKDQILGEPIGRNSAPAACSAMLCAAARRRGDFSALILPADHFVEDRKAFRRDVAVGLRRAAEGLSLVTFGVTPTSPRTDFGYIEAEVGRGSVRRVKRFVEKPSAARARGFLRRGRFFWNSGMFAWRSDRFMEEMKLHAPEVMGPLGAVFRSGFADAAAWAKAYDSVPSISLDYALMEKSRSVDVVPVSFPWSDLGTWAAVYEALSDGSGANVVTGRGRVVGGRGNLIRVGTGSVHLFGVDDLVVVTVDGTTLVTRRDKSSDLKTYLAVRA